MECQVDGSAGKGLNTIENIWKTATEILDKAKPMMYNASIYNYVLGVIASIFNNIGIISEI